MFYSTGKVLQLFIFPIDIGLILLAISIIFLRRGKEKTAKNWLIATWIFLFIFSLPLSNTYVGGILEHAYSSIPIGSYPKSDAIVLLGGSEAATLKPRLEAEELFGSRALSAVRLLKAGKSEVLVVASGIPYKTSEGHVRTGSDDLKDVLVDMGVPETKILLENHSRSTEENAKNTALMLLPKNLRSILLVTSAFHMRRAVHFFRGAGFEVTPVPTDRRVLDHPFAFSSLIPDEGALAYNAKCIKEYVGYLAAVLFRR